MVDSLVGGASDTPPHSPVSVSGDDILVKEEGGVQTITLNRPSKKNAITVKVRYVWSLYECMKV